MNRICLGTHAAAAVSDDFCIVFLRQGARIAALLYGRENGLVSAACGENGRTEYCKQMQGVLTADSSAAQAVFANHAADRFTETDSAMVWTPYDGTEYPMALCESSDGAQPAGESLAAEMARRNQKAYAYETGEDGICAEIITEHFAAVFLARKDMIYCRLGQNGYCEKGYAMLPGIVLRRNECRMIPDLTVMRQPYHPQEGCFAENGCAFPADGGWYWSVQAVTAEHILLNGCGGDTYLIARS